MSDLFKIIHNGETGKIEKVALTEEEIATLEAEESAALAKIANENAANAIKLAKKNQLLEKLGITEEEAKLLLS